MLGSSCSRLILRSSYASILPKKVLRLNLFSNQVFSTFQASSSKLWSQSINIRKYTTSETSDSFESGDSNILTKESEERDKLVAQMKALKVKRESPEDEETFKRMLSMFKDLGPKCHYSKAESERLDALTEFYTKLLFHIAAPILSENERDLIRAWVKKDYAKAADMFLDEKFEVGNVAHFAHHAFFISIANLGHLPYIEYTTNRMRMSMSPPNMITWIIVCDIAISAGEWQVASRRFSGLLKQFESEWEIAQEKYDIAKEKGEEPLGEEPDYGLEAIWRFSPALAACIISDFICRLSLKHGNTSPISAKKSAMSLIKNYNWCHMSKYFPIDEQLIMEYVCNPKAGKMIRMNKLYPDFAYVDNYDEEGSPIYVNYSLSNIPEDYTSEPPQRQDSSL